MLRRIALTVTMCVLLAACGLVPSRPSTGIGVTLVDGQVAIVLALCAGERVESISLENVQNDRRLSNSLERRPDGLWLVSTPPPLPSFVRVSVLTNQRAFDDAVDVSSATTGEVVAQEGRYSTMEFRQEFNGCEN